MKFLTDTKKNIQQKTVFIGSLGTLRALHSGTFLRAGKNIREDETFLTMKYYPDDEKLPFEGKLVI